ncbi:hypothetical protein O7626_24895 [Micromonospora sp. WMMD1102]|uniref:hypothetical protein n=1 Tax=Micromonospora sp. WMMD1102 TaxID=3016105 RepID=UPI002415014D|nr:hypothetical protein [Micromonospora sp. WMMD1102]MDG4789131.1 hypothetical protein [Micromonospora sp. WMMD1102]
MSDSLVRGYRLALYAYPRADRSRLGDEILGTLMDDARPGQRWPSFRETAILIIEGVRARLDHSMRRTPRETWIDGLHFAVVLLLAYSLSADVIYLASDHLSVRGGLVMLVLATVSLVAVLGGRWIAALASACVWLAVGLWAGEVSWPLLIAVALLALLVFRLRPERRERPVSWLLAVPAVLALKSVPYLPDGPVYLYDYEQAALVVALVAGLAGTLLDPRLSIVVASLVFAEVGSASAWLSSGDKPRGVHIAVGDFWTATVFESGPFPDVWIMLDGSWWTLCLAGAALLLIIFGSLRIRRFAEL